MAQLNSPGVSVSVINESFYGSASQGTVPFILIATAQDKLDSANAAVAEGTKAKNAGKLYEITSQRELLMNFGNPKFYDVNGTSLHGYPLNEYGLLAAHSYLGTSNRAFVMRADIDLEQLNASSTPPKSKAADGTYWLKSDTLDPAIYEFTSSGKWVKQKVFVATEFLATPSLLNPRSMDDVTPVGVPSNYEYVVLSRPRLLFDLLMYLNNGLSQEELDIIDTGVVDYMEINNIIIKRNGSGWKWFCGSVLGAGTEFNTNNYQYSDVYPSKKRDGITPNQVGDVWINTRENSYDLERYSATSDSFSTVSFPINVSFNEGVVYYENLARSTKGIQAGDVIAVAAEQYPLGIINNDYIGGLSFFSWTGKTYIVGAIDVPPDFTVNTPGAINFQILDDNNYQLYSLVVSGSLATIMDTVNSDATLKAYGVTCYYDSVTRRVVFDSIFKKTYGVVAPDLGFTSIAYTSCGVTGWEPIQAVTSVSMPTTSGVDGTYWYSEDFKVDILKNDGNGNWVETSVSPAFAVHVHPSKPTSPGNNDLWIDTTQVAEYPVIQRYNSGLSAWELVDNTDQTTPDGIVFGDARVDPTVSTIDPDAPDALMYPEGMLLFNTRYSTRNVKQYVVNKFPQNAEGDRDRWVSISGLKPDGSPYMGQDAVYRVISVAMQAAIVANDAIRSEDIYFNLLAAPGYPELIDELITLNDDRKETGFIIGDCPFDLKPSSDSVIAWAKNANNAITNGRDGLLTANHNLAVYYPCGLTTNVDGTEVAVPPSHMMLRAYAYNDQVAYQWFAPAGLQRGVITNATSVGYVSTEGEFIPVSLNEGIRDSLYLNNINPIRMMVNRGVIAWGQKTRSPASSALDRINVARLVNYIRLQAPKIVEPFLFEQNDKVSRKSAKALIDAMMSELVSLRGVYDWITVCDETNNTPSRIDRNELWIDIAVKPTKTIEFIYIPIRLKRTGDDLSI